MDRKPLNTISAVVYQCCADVNDANNSRYGQFLGWALWAYRELNFDVTGKLERVCLEMNEARKVSLPKGCVSWTKLTFSGGDRLYSLINQNGAFIWGQIGTAMKMAPSQFLEYDDLNGVMAFSSLISRQKVYLEYMTDGLCGNSETYINPQLSEYLRRAVHFQRADFDGETESQIARRGRDLYDAETKVRARVFGLTEEELIALL